MPMKTITALPTGLPAADHFLICVANRLPARSVRAELQTAPLTAKLSSPRFSLSYQFPDRAVKLSPKAVAVAAEAEALPMRSTRAAARKIRRITLHPPLGRYGRPYPRLCARKY